MLLKHVYMGCSENIEIEHVFQSKSFLNFISNVHTGCLSTFKGILFLQETHSSVKIEEKWIGDFKDKIYYSHGKTNLCGVLIAIYSNLNICVKSNGVTSTLV